VVVVDNLIETRLPSLVVAWHLLIHSDSFSLS